MFQKVRMIPIVKRLMLIMMISCLFIVVRSVPGVHADLYEGYDDAGNVDVISEEFINAFVYNFARYDFANIKRGMTLNEVENQLNESLEAMTHDNDTEEKYRANDLIVVMVENQVDSIYISPQDIITKDEILTHYNAPTAELAEHELTEGHSAFSYKALPSSNFEVWVGFDENNHVSYIKHKLDTSADVVNEDNALTFIKRGLSLNAVNPENYSFETPEPSDMGDLKINFTSDEFEGYLTLTEFGQLYVYNLSEELVTTVLIPFYGN